MPLPPTRYPLSVRSIEASTFTCTGRQFLSFKTPHLENKATVPTSWPGSREESGAMSILSFVLNVLWILSGGLWMAVAWIVAAVIMAITIVGLPWARAALNIALYTLLPFGQTAVSREEFLGADDIGTGFFGFISARFRDIDEPDIRA